MGCVAVGDVILRSSYAGLIHYGVVIGFDAQRWPVMAHNSPSAGGIVSTSFHEFLGKHNILGVRKFSGSIGSLEARLNESSKQPYNAITWNCETFVNYVQKGEAYSSQTRTILALSTLIFLTI